MKKEEKLDIKKVIFSLICVPFAIALPFLIITRLNICYIYLYLIFKFYYSEEKDEPAITSNANSENLKKDMEKKIEKEKIVNNDINETLKTIKNIGEEQNNTDKKETIIDENKT